jgi:hypothetical protein
MPFYRVYVGYGISADTCARILANGIPPEFYAIPVRVVHFYKIGSDQTLFEIEADDEQIANDWHIALKNSLGLITQYTPGTSENPDPPPTPLNVWAKVGTWSKTIGNATTVISGLAGAPKGVILFGSGKSGATVGTFDDYGGYCVGFSDGTAHRLNAICAQDNVATSNTGRTINSKAFTLMDETQAGTAIITETANTITLGASSFTINWSATTLATSGGYFVFGGNDIVECKVKDFLYSPATTGIQNFTGLGGVYDFGFFGSGAFTGSGYAAAQSSSGVISISAIGGHENSNAWSVTHSVRDAQSPSQQWRMQRTNRIHVAIFSTSPSSIETAGVFAGWTADGFDIDWYDPAGATNTLMTGLFVKGGKWDSGSFDQPLTNGTVTTLLSDPFAVVQGMMGFSINNVAITSNTSPTHSRMVIGAQDAAANKACLAYGGQHGANPTEEATVMVTDRFMKHITPAATASSSSTNAQCTVSDMATPGKFTVDYTTTDSTARQVVWFSLST